MGRLEVILGTMFSGKSTELILSVKKYGVVYDSDDPATIKVFKPEIDDRYEDISSHDGLKIKATYIKSADDIEKAVEPQTQVIGIDEVQFLDSPVVELCDRLARSGKTVIVAGLLRDFRDQIFRFSDGKGRIYDFLEYADDFKHMTAICTYKCNKEICGAPASRVNRLRSDGSIALDGDVVQIGGKNTYAARCREHHAKLESESKKTGSCQH